MKTRFPKPQVLGSVTSTNDYLKARVEEGQPRVVTAREQASGRGRHGRTWASERDRGLYVSYLCYPDIPAGRAQRLNQVAALAVALALEECCGDGLQTAVKPPNDVLLKGRKVAGILVETASLRDRLSWVVLGIGINLTQRSFSFEADPPPTSLLLEGLDAPPQEELCAILTRNLSQLLEAAERGSWARIEEEVAQRIWTGAVE